MLGRLPFFVGRLRRPHWPQAGHGRPLATGPGLGRHEAPTEALDAEARGFAEVVPRRQPRLGNPRENSRRFSPFGAVGCQKKRFGFLRIAICFPEGPLVLHEDGAWGVKRGLSTSLEGAWTRWGLEWRRGRKDRPERVSQP